MAYNVLKAYFTYPLESVTGDINNLQTESSHTQGHSILLYSAVALTIFNFTA